MGKLFTCRILNGIHRNYERCDKQYMFDIDDIMSIEKEQELISLDPETHQPTGEVVVYWKVTFSRKDMSTYKPPHRGFFADLFGIEPSVEETLREEAPRVFGGGKEANYIYIDNDEYERLIETLRSMGRFT